jgi:hypothetical protein
VRELERDRGRDDVPVVDGEQPPAVSVIERERERERDAGHLKKEKK